MHIQDLTRRYIFSPALIGLMRISNYLLDFVQNPYITEESVENEKGIIGQEINMKADEPDGDRFLTS